MTMLHQTRAIIVMYSGARSKYAYMYTYDDYKSSWHLVRMASAYTVIQ